MQKKIARLAAKDEADLKEVGNSYQADMINWKLVLDLVCNKRKIERTGANFQMRKIIITFLRKVKHRCKSLLTNYTVTESYVESKEKGMFCAIIWGTMEKYYEEIEAEIAKAHNVIKSATLNSICNIEQLVHDIYVIDNVDEWKIKLKQMYLIDVPHSIRVILFEIKDPKFRISKRTGELLSDEGAKLKNRIRNKYITKLDKYIYDVIIHTGDNYDISQKMINVVKKYGKLCDLQNIT